MSARGSDPGGVRVWRGEEVESLHEVHAALARATREAGPAGSGIMARVGDPVRRAFLRSAAKPIQLLPLVEDGVADRFGFTTEELAIMTASHNGEPFHLDAVRSALAKAGLEPAQLQCGPHEPLHVPSAEALRERGEKPTALHNNCSGKHAGMLAVCKAHGWPLETYRDPEHPHQRRIRARLAELAGVSEAGIGLAVDGCGAPTFALPVVAMAAAFARLAEADAERDDDRARAIGVVLDAMAAHPAHVAGTGRLCTDLMTRAGSRIVVKTGAEGVYVAVLRGESQGLALKVADGAKRAQDVALVALLAALGAIEPGTARALEAHARPALVNRAGVTVGRIDARLEWTWNDR
jgi:L-asparaginase II